MSKKLSRRRFPQTGSLHSLGPACPKSRDCGQWPTNGADPADNPQKPEHLAATIYHALGIPATAMWKDELDRPHHIYHAEPIRGLR